MKTQAIAYFLFGAALVALFGVIIAHYYSGKRNKHVEDVKYKMLDDDE
jgi:cytosine/uracil/thiamine/allantoin permease